MSKSRKAFEARTHLVEAVIRLLSEEDPSAIQARRLAREIGTSTMAVYYHFGGMPQLLSEVALVGFRRLDARLGAVPVTDDPVADICRLALTYRDVARENPHLYDLMFGLSAPEGHRPDPSPHQVGDQNADGVFEAEAANAYRHLVDASERAMLASRIREDDPATIAAQLWSLLHGYVTLELAGHFDHLTDSTEQILLLLGRNLLIGLGDTPERIEASAAFSLDPRP
ncbi:TetR/AcrR family transcriptional regulator [Saccharopolyspora sp. NPDC050389]|uniref:TetR/AcrR family transcriptional regulator n=1 Tax=Saccharopolyspora sp. NPDC050389 TaxID=3155516 RepID=UPI0033C74856